MREQLAEEKGRYCRVVYTKDGRVKLEPVKVPQHVKQERRERAERRALLRRIEWNRERAQILDVSFTLFLAVALAVCCMVCAVYLSLQNQTMSRLEQISALQTKVEAAADENDLQRKRMDAKENLTELQGRAARELGMQKLAAGQIIYYSVDASDYMMQYDDID